MKSIKERGLIKENVKSILFRNENVMRVMFDNYDDMKPKQRMTAFNDHCKSHLFIDGTLEGEEVFIFFDVVIPEVQAQIKECKIIMYLACHRDLLDNFGLDGYYGNRTDILSQAVEEALLDPENAKTFGIGDLVLENVDIYNNSEYYGVNMIYSVKCFR